MPNCEDCHHCCPAVPGWNFPDFCALYYSPCLCDCNDFVPKWGESVCKECRFYRDEWRTETLGIIDACIKDEPVYCYSRNPKNRCPDFQEDEHGDLR